jgi:hypothetical protein
MYEVLQVNKSRWIIYEIQPTDQLFQKAQLGHLKN